jgi:Xaa-Pro aminopeptidase
VADTLTERNLQHVRIGLDSPSSAMADVQKLLPELEMQPCGLSLRALRRIKHSDELETMRIAAAPSDSAMAAYQAGAAACGAGLQGPSS